MIKLSRKNYIFIISILLIAVWYYAISSFDLSRYRRYEVVNESNVVIKQDENLLQRQQDEGDDEEELEQFIRIDNINSDTNGFNDALEMIVKDSESDNDETLIDENDIVNISEEEWKQLIHPNYAKLPRLEVDVVFHRLTDKYHLIDLKYNETELLEIAKIVIRVWAKANILIRFRKSEVLGWEKISDNRAEAYKLYVQGSKEEGSPEQIKERQEATALIGKKDTDFLYYHFLRIHNNECCVVEKFIVGADKRRVWDKRNTLHFYPLYYLRWYNGFALDRMVAIRGGSCWGPENKLLNGAPVHCRLGYKDGIGPLAAKHENRSDALGAREWERRPFTIQQFARIAAHEVGHFFQLNHQNGERCTSYDKVEEMNLMHQQKKVTITGKPCSMNNELSIYARNIVESQIRYARGFVSKLDSRESKIPPNIQRMGTSMENTFDFARDMESAAVLFTKFPSPCDGSIKSIRIHLGEKLSSSLKIMIFAAHQETSSKPNQLFFTGASQTILVENSIYGRYRHSEINLEKRRKELFVKKGDFIGIVSSKSYLPLGATISTRWTKRFNGLWVPENSGIVVRTDTEQEESQEGDISVNDLPIIEKNEDEKDDHGAIIPMTKGTIGRIFENIRSITQMIEKSTSSGKKSLVEVIERPISMKKDVEILFNYDIQCS